jgi:hypothetical protein
VSRRRRMPALTPELAAKLPTAADVARRLGKDVRTIRRWIERRELPGGQLGGRWYVFTSSELGSLLGVGAGDVEAALGRS